MKNDAITTKQLMKYIKGPDFPTGGIVDVYKRQAKDCPLCREGQKLDGIVNTFGLVKF